MEDGKLEELPRLTPKRKRFILEYLKDRNAAQAVLRAGYDTTPENARVIGHQLLNNTSLLPHLNKAIEEQEYRLEYDADMVMENLMSIADTNVFDFVTYQNGRAILMKDPDQLTVAQQKTIKSLKETSNGIEVQFWDKMKSLELIGKYKDMFTNNIKVEGNGVINVNYNKRERKED